jgi:Domain of unknown function (DUF4922)
LSYRVADARELAPFAMTEGFAGRVGALLKQQEATWLELREGIAALRSVELRDFNVKKSRVTAQFNPRRIVSTAARVDAASIGQRPCFLCPENLPVEEKGIEFGERFVVLCNPFPVVRNHVVVASVTHIPQRIDGNFGLLLDLTKELGEDYFAIYNGPACGASAPDHLHFQAALRGQLAIVEEARSWPSRRVSEIAASLIDYRVNVLVARNSSREVLLAWFGEVYEKLSLLTCVEPEPLLNLIVTFGEGLWTVYLFPRFRHRAESYFAPHQERLTVSPAAIDLGGLLVVPEAEHFARITAADIERIYTEVTLDGERFSKLA